MKFLHCADLHIGSRLETRRVRGEAPEYLLFLAFERILDLAREENVDLLLIAGDFTESKDISESVLSEVRRLLEQERDYDVLIVAGNHDPYCEGSGLAKHLAEVPRLHLFRGETERVDFPALRCSVFGCSFSSIYQRESLLPKAKVGESRQDIRIGLVHGSVGTPQEGLYNEIPLIDVASCGLDYLALGHIHKTNFPFKEGEKMPQAGDTVYLWPGNPQGRNFKEDGPRGVILGEIRVGEPLRLRFRPIAERLFIRERFDLSDCRSDRELATALEAALRRRDPEHYAKHFYEIELVGRSAPDYSPRIDQISAALRYGGASELAEHCSFSDRSLRAYDLAALREEQGLRGAFVREIEASLAELAQRRAETESRFRPFAEQGKEAEAGASSFAEVRRALEREERVLQQALDYGLRAMDGQLPDEKGMTDL